MNRIVLFMFLFLAFACAQGQGKGYYPSPTGFVNDFEHDFSEADVSSLDKLVKQLLTETMKHDSLKGIEMAVVTVTPAMYGDEKEISSYATKLGDKWNLGTKSPNKGIIIVYSKTLRKVAIVTGTGLDNILPAAECQNIVNEKMVEEYRKGNPYQALVVAVKSIAQKLGVTLF